MTTLPPRKNRIFSSIQLTVLLLAAAVLGVFFLFMAELNQDEGWYLYAARLVASGSLPYRDFAFTQSPLLPLVYSLADPLVARMGLLGGRLFTLLLSLASAALAARAAARLAPRGLARHAVLLTLALLLVNAFHATFAVVVKTYALSSLALSAAVLALTHLSPRRSWLPAAAAALSLALCAATRVSFALATPLVFLYLLLFRARFRRGAWLVFAAVSAAAFAALFLPFFLMAPDAFRFGLLEYHSARAVGSLFSALAYRAGCLSLFAQNDLPALLLVLWALFSVLAVPRPAPLAPAPDAAPSPRLVPFLWILLAALALLHISAPFPYDDYLVPLCPLFALLAALLALRAADRFSAFPRLPALLPLAVLCICLLHSFASPRIQNAFLAGRDRIWWNLRSESPVAQLRHAAQWLRGLTDENGGTHLLTQDLYLAVEARLPVPHGLEMGPFSYAPDFPLERARRLGLLNRDMLADILLSATNAPVAPLSGYSFAIAVPEVLPVSRDDSRLFESILAEQFELVETIPAFGQAATPLRIFQRIPPPEPAETLPEDPDSALP